MSTDGLDLAIVAQRLVEATGDDRWAESTAQLIAGGKSNLTFEINSAAGSLVLRRPPTGPLLPSAHDMEREVRVQRALVASPVPVPEVVLFDPTGVDLGAPYYVMNKVPGVVVRETFPPGFADQPADRRRVGQAMVDTLTMLHQVDPVEVGLDGFGRPAGFMERQVARWSDQSERSRTEVVPELDELVRRLAKQTFPETPGAIVHGDFRLDNCLLDPDNAGRVAAVLDWELATLGDPLADLGMLLFYWCEAGEAEPVLTPAITALDGFATRVEVAAQYAAQRSIDLDLLPAYVAFAHLKFAVIAQGIAQRSRSGAMAGQQFGDLGEEIVRIASEGLERFEKAEI